MREDYNYLNNASTFGGIIIIIIIIITICIISICISSSGSSIVVVTYILPGNHHCLKLNLRVRLPQKSCTHLF